MKSRLFAEYHHTFLTHDRLPQLYGGKPYIAHLKDVVNVLRVFGFREKVWIDAGYLHDVIEDTAATLDDVTDRFGPVVGSLVWAVTGVGHNRKTRNQTIYEKIGENPAAAILKMADRIANTTGASENYLSMYRKELDAFREHVGRHAPEAMWARLMQNFETPGV